MLHGRTQTRTRRNFTHTTQKVILTALLGCSTLTTSSGAHADTGFPPENASMLDRVNWYRAQSGLDPVVQRADWQNDSVAHSCWMLQNGMSHDEPAGTPGYSAGGARAGVNSNVAVSSGTTTNGAFVDLWMTGPFHAVGILRPGLREIGEGRCDITNTYPGQPWRSAGTLDVLRGLKPAAKSTVHFPGNGSTTHLRNFIAETPDPRTYCGWQRETVGLPVIALLPAAPRNTTATITGPNGPLEVCVLTAANTTGDAKALLGGDNAVVVLPRTPLADGTHTVVISSTTASTTWSFTVAPNADSRPTTTLIGGRLGYTPVDPVRVSDTRENFGLVELEPGITARLQISGQNGIGDNVRAISVNYTVTDTADAGYLTVWPCGPLPNTATVNWGPGAATVAAGTVSGLDTGGGICLYASTRTELVVDVNGVFGASDPAGFTATTPVRILDTRTAQHLTAGQILQLDIAGTYNVPNDAQAVAVNMTAVGANRPGYITAYPCGGAAPFVSNLNPVGPDAVANFAIIPLEDKKLCVRSSVATDLVIDLAGWFGQGGSLLQPVTPVRVIDTRQADYTWSAGMMKKPVPARNPIDITLAGRQGLPSSLSGALVNVTSTETNRDGYVTVYPSGSPLPLASVINPRVGVAVGNTVPIGSNTGIAVYPSVQSHVVVDVVAVWLPRDS
jgi:uncharacterized protein YkwD